MSDTKTFLNRAYIDKRIVILSFSVDFLEGIIFISFFRTGLKFFPTAIPVMLIVPIVKNCTKSKSALAEVKAAITAKQ